VRARPSAYRDTFVAWLHALARTRAMPVRRVVGDGARDALVGTRPAP